MKKSTITILSVVLNVALFSALAYYNKLNGRNDGAPAIVFLTQHLSDTGALPSGSQGTALASTAK